MNKIMKILMIMLIAAFVTSAYAAFPEITQVSYNPSPAIPGSTMTVIIQLENKDSSSQKNVTLRLEDSYPFTVKIADKNPNPNNIGDISPFGNAQATFIVYVDPTAQNQTYELPIVVSTANDTTGKKSNFPIIISGKEPLLKVVNVSDVKLLPGEEKEITFTIQNVGTSPAYDVIVEMQEDRTITATGNVIVRDITPIGAATAYLSSINPGEQKTTTLKLSVSTTATINNYTLPVQVSYRDSTGIRTTSTSYAGISVFGNAQIDAELKTMVGTTTPGQKATITIEIFNKGLGKADFTLAEISTASGVISKPRQFIGTLGPNDVDTLETTIVFDKIGDQIVDVKVQYKDSDSTMKTTTISIPIKSQGATDQGISPIIWIIAIVVIVALVWNFGFRGKKKK
ncbi:MAG: CARDB domain-containing protein [archaeon]